MTNNTSLAQVNMTVYPTRSYKSPFSIDLLCAGRGWKTRTDSDNSSILAMVRNVNIPETIVKVL
jgi:hypothetical protein